jgi:hypothetical protein
MNPPDKPDNGQLDSASDAQPSSAKKVRVEDILTDLRAGLRTKGFLVKYGLSMGEFEYLLKKLIKKGLFTREEFTAWKDHGSRSPSEVQEYHPGKEAPGIERDKGRQGIVTYVIRDPEKNDTWALQLFSTQRDQMQGHSFKVNLHGRKYSFIVEELIFRGQVSMLEAVDHSPKPETREKREKAIEFISAHGWAAYLETRAIEANVEDIDDDSLKRARLVLLRCRNNTFLAALHTPAPAINLYVGPSLENIKQRLAKSVDTKILGI